MIKTVLFITEQGSRITRQGQAIIVSKNNEKQLLFPLANISQIVIMGRVEISTALMGLLMREGVDTVFLTSQGHYNGRLTGQTSKNIFIRERQFNLRQQQAFCLQFSREIVSAKIRNTRNLLRKQQHQLYEQIKPRIDNAINSVAHSVQLSALRGFEGAFAALYFRHFSQLLNNDFGFRKRIKHPPPDPVNILLSFGYTLLFNSIYSITEAAGLDPFAGCYHQSAYGHPALVSDLMEPYRAAIIDRMVIRLMNTGAITGEHFIDNDSKIELQTPAIQVFVKEYQTVLQRRFQYNERSETVWQIFQKDVQQFCRLLKEESDEYKPFIFR